MRSNRSCALLPSAARACVYRRGAALSRSTAAAGSVWISPCTVLQFSTANSATSFAAHGGRNGLSNAPIIDVTPGTLTPVSGSTYQRAPPRVRVRITIELLSDLTIYLELHAPSAEARGPWRGNFPAGVVAAAGVRRALACPTRSEGGRCGMTV